MLRVAAIVTLVGVIYFSPSMTATPMTATRPASGVAGAESGSGVRMPLRPPSDSTTKADLTVEVQRGDHMWRISARHVSEIDPGREIAAYWRRVVDVNTPIIRSGDPDLIYPGEQILLPELSGPP